MSMEDGPSNNGGDSVEGGACTVESLDASEHGEVSSSSDDENENDVLEDEDIEADSEEADIEGDAASEPKMKRRKKKKREKSRNMRRNIKSLMKQDDLGVSTKEAQAEEQERLRRIQAQQQRLQKELWERIQQGRLQQQQVQSSRLSNLASQLPQHRLQPPPMTIDLSSSEDESTNDGKTKIPVPMMPVIAPADGGSDSDIQGSTR